MAAGAAALAGCGGDSAAPASVPAEPVAVSGTVTGLGTDGVVLSNGDATVALAAGATTFTFPATVAPGTAIDVQVASQPSTRDEVCAVSGGQGAAGSAMAIVVACHPTTWALSTLSGQAFAQFPVVDGPAGVATISQIGGLVHDAAGNLWFGDYQGADGTDGLLRKLSPDGSVVTVAGVGKTTVVDGALAQAGFSGIEGLAIDAAGNLYATDANTVRRISPDGQVTTLAGSSVETGLVDGAGADARFDGPVGIAVDAGGAIFVADSDNRRIRRIGTDGVVSTFAGNDTSGIVDGMGAAASFVAPRGLAFGPGGDLYVTDAGAIRKVAPDGTVSTLLAQVGTCSTDGQGVESPELICNPEGIAADADGNLFVGDPGSGRLIKVTPDGVATIVAASVSGGGTVVGDFFVGRDVTLDASGAPVFSRETYTVDDSPFWASLMHVTPE